MNPLSVFIKNTHIFMYVRYAHCNFAIQQTEDSLAVQMLNTVIFLS